MSESMGYNKVTLRWHGAQVGTGCEFSFCAGELGEQSFLPVFPMELWMLSTIVCNSDQPNAGSTRASSG